MKLAPSILTFLIGGVLSLPFPPDYQMPPPPQLPIPGYELPDDDPYNPGLPLELHMEPGQHVPQVDSYGQGMPPAMSAQQAPEQQSQQHSSSGESQQKPRCNPGEKFEFWCEEMVHTHRYSQTCEYDSVNKVYRFVPDRSTCPQEDTKQYFPPTQGEYHVLKPDAPPQGYQVLHPQAPPPQYEEPPRGPPQHYYKEPQPHQHEQPPHHYYKEPKYPQPDTPSQYHYPDQRPRPVQGGRYPRKPGRYPPRRRPQGQMSNIFQTLMKIFAMQKFVNKDGADDSKFKDMLKYFMMFQRPGMQGGNDQQLWTLLYGLPGLEDSSSLDLGEILKSLSGNPFGDTDFGALMGNPMMTGLMGDDSPFSSLFGSGGNSPLNNIMPYLQFMGGSKQGEGMKGLFGGMSPLALMGLGKSNSALPGNPLMSLLLSSMKKGS